jgi:hypothetical protein
MPPRRIFVDIPVAYRQRLLDLALHEQRTYRQQLNYMVAAILRKEFGDASEKQGTAEILRGGARQEEGGESHGDRVERGETGRDGHEAKREEVTSQGEGEEIMTGIFVRVQRDGRWQTLEIDELSDEEICTVLEARPAEELVRWIVVLAGWIRDHVREDVSHG